jgi:hypothetical protein
MEQPVDQEMIYIPKDVRESLEKYAAAERKRMDNPLVSELITWKSLAQHILRNEVQKRGHYVGRKGA